VRRFLLGISCFEQLSKFSFNPTKEHQVMILQGYEHHIKAAIQLRHSIESLPSETNAQIERKNVLNYEANAHLARLKLSASVLLSVEMQNLKGDAAEMARVAAHLAAHRAVETGEATDAMALTEKSLSNRRPFHWPLEFPEVFDAGESPDGSAGFDAFVGNPPFIGGKKLTGEFGDDYRDYLIERLANGIRGHADLCAYFFLRANFLLKSHDAMAGLLATNTIAQGDSREVGLEQVLAAATLIPRAISSRPWPGEAALEVAHIWLRRGSWLGKFLLDDRPVAGITAFLTETNRSSGKAYRLESNANKSFIGSYAMGMGFVLTSQQAAMLLRNDARNGSVVFPYLGGEDLNSSADQSARRWIINFHDWPLDRSAEGRWSIGSDEQRSRWLRVGRVPEDYPNPVAADFPECLELIERLVKPERLLNSEELARLFWWRYFRIRGEMRAAIAHHPSTLVLARVSRTAAFEFASTSQVFSDQVVVFVGSAFHQFAVLQSSIHVAWALELSSTLKGDLRYTPSDCFDTFPFPSGPLNLESIGSAYQHHRKQLMQTRQEGLTKTYNRFHDRGEQSADIARLRALHAEMDQAVAAAYGWSDLDLGHGFHATKQGERYTLSESARRTVLDRLLALNHQRYEEELKAGLHDKKKPKPPKSKNPVSLDGIHPAQPDLLPPEQPELF
jgi:hypothetical protein